MKGKSTKMNLPGRQSGLVWVRNDMLPARQYLIVSHSDRLPILNISNNKTSQSDCFCSLVEQVIQYSNEARLQIKKKF